MIRTLKLLIIAGARPNFMKVAPDDKVCPLCTEATGNQNEVLLQYRLVHTGQHYDEKMSNIFFNELGIPAPDINLGVGSGSHAVQTANVMAKFEPVCEQEPRLGSGGRGREFHDGLHFGLFQNGYQGGARGSGPAELRPHDARRGQSRS